MIFAIAASVWGIGSNVFTTAAAAIATTVFAQLASQFHSNEAWAHIPRNRHDRERSVPPTWSITSAVATTLAMLGGLAVCS